MQASLLALNALSNGQIATYSHCNVDLQYTTLYLHGKIILQAYFIAVYRACTRKYTRSSQSLTSYIYSCVSFAPLCIIYIIFQYIYTSLSMTEVGIFTAVYRSCTRYLLTIVTSQSLTSPFIYSCVIFAPLCIIYIIFQYIYTSLSMTEIAKFTALYGACTRKYTRSSLTVPYIYE